MNNKGLAGEGRFGDLHPFAIAIFYILILAIIMISNSPVFLLTAAAVGLVYAFVQRGAKQAFKLLRLGILIAIFVALFNGLFTHNGATVLFFIGSNRITAEAILYGANMSLIIITVIFWFSSFNVLMTSDKLIHVFGKIAPVIGLVISMIFRFIPLLQERMKEIKAGQASLGRANIKGPIKKIQQFTKEVSTLISWSLEASIESADSMSARGYGLKGRTNYSIFKILSTDIAVILISVLLGAAVIVGYQFQIGKIVFYPFIGKVKEVAFLWEALVFLCFLGLLLIPLLMDLYGEVKWKKSVSKI